MADSWFSLSTADQQEALEVAAASTGRPAHLLEKDIWVVWTLGAIYGSEIRFPEVVGLSRRFGQPLPNCLLCGMLCASLDFLDHSPHVGDRL